MSPPPRLKAKLWVQSTLRCCVAANIMATVARRGDPDAGSVLIKQNLMGGGFIVLTPMRLADDSLGWRRGTGTIPVSEAEADLYIARQVGRDGDLWVVEIEERGGALPFDHQLIED
jgi:GMP synthase (glutamine-hydrolysing)